MNNLNESKPNDGLDEFGSLIQSYNDEIYISNEYSALLKNSGKDKVWNKTGQDEQKEGILTHKLKRLNLIEYISVNKESEVISSKETKAIKYLHKKRLEERGYRMTNKKLGEGGYGIVYKIYLKNINKPLACKIMLLSKKDKSTALENISHEIYTMKCVNHVNIVSMADNFIYSHAINMECTVLTHSYIIMEYANNGTLWSKLKKTGPMDSETTKNYFKQIVNGLLHLHLKGIAHRDLKLGNILLTVNDKCEEIVKLADFGLSRQAHSKEAGLVRFSKPAGTLAYMSPQILICYINNHQKTLQNSYDPFKADIWALGVCLYLLLSRVHPFDSPPPNKAERVNFAKRMLEKQINKEWQMPILPDESNGGPTWYSKLLKTLFEPISKNRTNIFIVAKTFELKF